MTNDPYGNAFDASVDEFLQESRNAMDRDTTSEEIGGMVVDWRTLTDPETIAEAWTALREWVEWFVVRYELPNTAIPDCWWKHGALVEELSALHTAHQAAFDSTDSGLGPVTWHERLTLARARFQVAYKSGCLDGHVDRRRRVFPDADDDWDTWTRSTHA